ncbi:acyl-CoA dehydrogenase family protein [Catenuloplanes atrovinosus]|uniref:Alkylation response protein AidB-like acyl-CoA dehydrogenase n=1 Tax=Catenuloplanes atrovinosus TaxID=137266 RepID=A0AAE3YN23_9ACTN|nr:acyl-CoA dehydrogenase family protein [Catenuloplanes atrovinosus]MDR7275371.1 alkylation response protein AidB-like acyl-CoA dehydrogenase [Catenuloplanes atrovinosus]
MTALLETAATLADTFAERAAAHDRDNTFPYRNVEDLRAAGFLRLSVPEELGGLGAGMAEVLAVLERLAMGCGSTALAATMHISPLGQWAGVWRRTRDPHLERLLRRAADGTLIWASLTGELGLRNDLTDARTTAVRVPGGYRLTGRKSFATNSAVATDCSVTARYELADGGPRLLLCRISLRDPAVTVLDTWDTLGMRATRSGDVRLDGVFVPDAQVVHSLPVGHLDARVAETVWAWAMPAFSAVYTGIAAGALDFAARQARRRGTDGDPLVQDAVAECVVLVETARALMHRHAAEVADRSLFAGGVQAAIARSALVKYVASNNAVRVVQRLVDVLGGAAFARALPYERMFRDAQAGVIMPMSNLAARRLIGADALGLTTAPVHGRFT